MSRVVKTFDLRCFKVIGMWQLISASYGHNDSSYFYILNVTVMAVFVPYVIMEFFGSLTSRYDFVTLTEKLSVNITLLESAIKFLYCYTWHKQIAALLGVFEENFLLCMEHNRNRNLRILEAYAKNLTSNINLFILIIYATVGVWNSLPILSCFLESSCATLQIMPSWYPIAIDRAPVKQLVYLLEFIIMCYCASLLYSVNCLILAFARMISSQVEILNLSMINIGETAAKTACDKLVQHGEDPEAYELFNLIYQNEIDKLQRDCLIDYQKILSQVALMEKTFSPLFLFQLAVSTITLCLVLISLTSKTAADSKMSLTLVCKFSMYLIFGLMELFVYSWCGHIIQDQTGSLHGSLYEMAWLSNSRGFKWNALQAMTRALRPSCLTAGKFWPVDFKTFAGVLKMSYSLFTFLYGSGLKK